MKKNFKIITFFLIFQISFSYELNINGKYICKTNENNKGFLSTTKIIVIRNLEIQNNQIKINDKYKINYCLKKYILIGNYTKCIPRWNGFVTINGNILQKNNKATINIKTIKIKENKEFKQNYIKTHDYNDCYKYKSNKLSQICSKSKNTFLKYWNKTKQEIKNLYNIKNFKITINKKNEEYLQIEDNNLNTKFNCKKIYN